MNTQDKITDKLEKDPYEELYSQNHAEQIKDTPLSDSIRAALYVEVKIEDLKNSLYSLHRILYGEIDDYVGDKITEAIEPIKLIADKYLIKSTNTIWD